MSAPSGRFMVPGLTVTGSAAEKQRQRRPALKRLDDRWRGLNCTDDESIRQRCFVSADRHLTATDNVVIRKRNKHFDGDKDDPSFWVPLDPSFRPERRQRRDDEHRPCRGNQNNLRSLSSLFCPYNLPRHALLSSAAFTPLSPGVGRSQLSKEDDWWRWR